MVRRSGYLRDFLEFWSPNPAAEKIWMSIFTPQKGANPVECISRDERIAVVQSLLELRTAYPKLDMPEGLVKELLAPPTSPARCIFARTTRTISADFKTQVEPCQFGGEPDCSRCGCIASMGLAAIGNYKIVGSLTAGHLFWASASLGDAVQRFTNSGERSKKQTSEPLAEVIPISEPKLTTIKRASNQGGD